MKNVVLFLLISVYSLSSLGIGINSSYCCGKLKSVSLTFISSPEPECGKTHSDGKKCCDSKHQVLKVNDTHLAADHIILPFGDQLAVLPHFNLYTAPACMSQQGSASYAHAPPLLNGIPIYIANCTYRI